MRLVSRPNVRTLDELGPALADQLALRRRELDDLGAGLESMPDGPARDARTRACWVLLYAHWEGFIKVAVACYLDLFRARRVALSRLHTGLRAVALRQSFSELREQRGLAAFLVAAEDSWDPGSVFRVDPDRMVRHTWDSMDWDAVAEAMGAVGGDRSALGASMRTAIGELGKVRNRIAHGDLVSPDPASLHECRKHIEDAMVAFQAQVLDSALRQSERLDDLAGVTGGPPPP
jgi:hypothetical protein